MRGFGFGSLVVMFDVLGIAGTYAYVRFHLAFRTSGWLFGWPAYGLFGDLGGECFEFVDELS